MMKMPFKTVMFGIILLASVASPAFAQTESSAKAFIDYVFQRYKAGGHGIPTNARYFHPSLLALIQQDEKAAEAAHEMPDALDGDLICYCQEWNRFSVSSMQFKIVKPGVILATVSFDIYETADSSDKVHRVMRFTLVPVGVSWRIYDIEILSEADVPLRKELQKEFELFRKDSEIGK
ncbi:MAG: hypothetical protein WAN35_08965 [Terracidiphilus sp.]